jgi:Kef-type K+ transport system membrane component KefB
LPSIDFSPLEIQFLEALALILIACLTVPIFKRIGLGAILGYLAAGVIVGASLTLGFTKDPDKLLHFAEFGVVLFLFVIGLEMKPSRLWEMRGDIFGIGLAQVVRGGAGGTALVDGDDVAGLRRDRARAVAVIDRAGHAGAG